MYMSDYRRVLHICVHYKRLVPRQSLCNPPCTRMGVGVSVGRGLVLRPINSINLHNCTQACLICIYCIITHINGPRIQRQPPKWALAAAANAVEACIWMMHPRNDDDNDNDGLVGCQLCGANCRICWQVLKFRICIPYPCIIPV